MKISDKKSALSFPGRLLLIVVFITFIAIMGAVWSVMNIFNNLDEQVKSHYGLKELYGSIGHINEVMILSSRLAASTGSPDWEDRYLHYKPVIKDSFDKIAALETGFYGQDQTGDLSRLINSIVDIQNRSFDLVKSGRSEDAMNLLQETEFVRTQNSLENEFESKYLELENRYREFMANENRNISIVGWLIALGTIILLAVWIRLLSGLKRHLEISEKLKRDLILRDLSLASSNNGITIADATLPDMPLIYINKAFEKITGYSARETLGKNCRFLQGNEKNQEGLAELRLAIKEERDCSVVLKNFKKDGTMFWNELRISPIKDNSGKTTHFVGIQNDITRRIFAQDQLKESESRIRAIMESAVEGIITIDEFGTIEVVNPAASRLFGYHPDELIGNNVKMLMPNPDRDQHDQYLRNYLNTGERKIIGIGREVDGRRKDGSTFPMFLSISEFHLDGTRHFTGMFHDITERKQIEAEREQIQKTKDEFLAIASHDIKNPLASIMGGASILDSALPEGTPMTDKGRKLVTMIVNGSKTMKRIIEDFLDFQAMEDGKIKIDMVPGNLNSLVDKVIQANQDYAERKHIQLMNEISDDLPDVSMDPNRIEQILQNLIGNAVKFSSAGDVVRVRTFTDNGFVHCEVVDTGPGLTDEDQQKVFGKYARLSNKPTGGEKSSGLGLAICKQLIDLHYGQIGIRNNPDKGATFWFNLPL